MKLKNLYDLESFDRFCDSASAAGFQDAQGGVTLARHLTMVDPTILEKKYPDLALLNSGIEINNTGGYARAIQTLRKLGKGGFSVDGDRDDNKGKIGMGLEDNTIKVFPHAGFSEWSDDEIKEAELGNINLPAEYVATHDELYKRAVDKIGLIGLTGTTGLLNSTAFTATGAGGTIESRTAQQMYDEISGLLLTQWAAVNNTAEYKASRVLMPVRVLNKINATILNSAAGASTVLKALQDNFPGVQFSGTYRADNAAGGGDLATTATVAYNPSPESMKLRIPVPLTIGEIIKRSSFNYRVDSKFRIAGLDVLETTSGRILTGL